MYATFVLLLRINSYIFSHMSNKCYIRECTLTLQLQLVMFLCLQRLLSCFFSATFTHKFFSSCKTDPLHVLHIKQEAFEKCWLGPFATVSCYIVIHQVSLLSHAACASMSTTTTTTTTRDRGDRYGPIEWASKLHIYNQHSTTSIA